MIKSTIVIMTLLGCDCDAKECAYLADAGKQWTSVAHCEADMKTQVLSRANLNFPLVTAVCTALPGGVEPAPTTLAATTPTAPDHTTTPVAGNRTISVFRQTGESYELVKSGLVSFAGQVTVKASQLLTASSWLVFR